MTLKTKAVRISGAALMAAVMVLLFGAIYGMVAWAQIGSDAAAIAARTPSVPLGPWDIVDHGLVIISGLHPLAQVAVILSIIVGAFWLGWRWSDRPETSSETGSILDAINGVAKDLSDLRRQFTEHVIDSHDRGSAQRKPIAFEEERRRDRTT